MNVIKPFRQFCALAIMLGLSALAHGQIIPIDDFDDMDPTLPGWTTMDFSAGQPWGPGLYDVSNGDLRIYHSGSTPVPPNTSLLERGVAATWDNSADPLFSNGFVRSQLRTDSSHNSTSILMRWDWNTFTGYVFFGNTTPVPPGEPGSEFHVSKLVNGEEFRLWDSDILYVPGEDWNVEYGTVGSQITAKVWKVGDTEPQLPQFSDTDTTATSGQIVLVSDVVTSDIPSFADATFDSIVFIVPEPASVALVLVGLVGLLALRR